MYLKIQQKLHCLRCISKQTMRSVVKKTRLNSSKDDFLMKSFPSSTKRKLSILLNFLFLFLSFNGVFLTLKCRTLVLKHLHGDRAAAICFQKGKSECSRALNASYTFQPLMSFWFELSYNKQFIQASYAWWVRREGTKRPRHHCQVERALNKRNAESGK